MESNTARSGEISDNSSKKRRLSGESDSSIDRRAARDCELPGNDSTQFLRQLESKNRELETHINTIYTEFKTMQSVNQDLRSQVQTLQQQYDGLLSQNRELESRINNIEYRSNSIEMMNKNVPRQTNDVQHHRRDVRPDNSNLDQFVKDFEERCELVECDNQDLTERLDSCQQNVFKMKAKSDDFENQLNSLQQRLNNFEILDTNMQHNQTLSTQQLVKDDERQKQKITITTYLNENMNNLREQVHNNNDDCTLIEKALCTPCEDQILLSTDEIQYGVFDVCDKYNVILVKEEGKLKLFDHQKQLDERPWGELKFNNFATCIHWCSFLNSFLILYRYQLHTLSLKLNPTTSQMEFDVFEHIKSIRVYSLKHDGTNRVNNAFELLRFITTSPNLPGYLYLNRGYRRIELINTNLWKTQRGWSKSDLDYGDRDEIRLIICSHDGSYLAMNINQNDRVRFVDIRKHDGQLTLIKTIRMSNDSVSLSPKVQIPFDQEQWLVVDEKNQCYSASANPNNQAITPIRTDQILAIQNVPIRLRFVRNNTYLLVGAVIGDGRLNLGTLCFYKLPPR